MKREREYHGESVRDCVLCGDEQPAVLYVSFRRSGPMRRRSEVAWRWRCVRCRTKTTVAEPALG